MNTVALILEGPSDKLFFQTLAPWLRELGYAPYFYQAKDRGRLIKDATRHVSLQRQSGRDLVILVLDQDADECAPTTATKVEAAGGSDVLVVVVCRCLEAWLLADDEAVRHATGQQYRCQGMTDNLQNPVDHIRDVFFRATGTFLSKIEMVKRLAPRFDIERASANSVSMQRFVDRLRARASS